MLVGAIGYSISAITFLVLLAVLLTDKHHGTVKKFMAAAILISGIWSFAMAFQAIAMTQLRYYQVIEFIYSVAWILFLLRMLLSSHAERKYSFVKVATVSSLVGAALIIFLLFYNTSAATQDVQAYSTATLVMHLTLSVIGVVLIEQIIRSTRPEQKWVIKFMCLGLGGMFVYNFYMYSDGLLYNRIDTNLWQARGYVNSLVVPLIGLSVLRDPLWSPKIFISRRVVFHTTALLSSGVYLLVMGVGGYYVKEYGGSWGPVAQALFLFATILMLSLFLFSRRIRARLKVFVNKHFYPYKYDYREEWLRFIGSLSTTDTASKLHLKTIKSIAQIIDSPGGVLFLKNDGYYECIESWNMPKLNIVEPSEASLPKFLENNEFVISIDEFENEPEVYNRLGFLKLPDWIIGINPWLIVPLIHMDKLIGYIVLEHSTSRAKSFNWEDSDLLKTAARQAASYLAYDEAIRELAVAKQFEEFNKLSTYVIHDIKNLMTQLSLITTNAEKHKDNPLFMKDAIDTINNSVNKMNGLINKLKTGWSNNTEASKVDIILLLQELMKGLQFSAKKPVPEFDCDSDHVYVKADKDQLFSIFSHLIENAQDATSESGSIAVTQQLNGHIVAVSIEDTGVGMADSFIQDQLFKPFRTTKGEKGMGIGAFESREIVKVLGGDITVESEINTGTKFTVSLPIYA